MEEPKERMTIDRNWKNPDGDLGDGPFWKVMGLDELARICGYFNPNTDVNNGYGCDHCECRDGERVDEEGDVTYELDADGNELGTLQGVMSYLFLPVGEFVESIR